MNSQGTIVAIILYTALGLTAAILLYRWHINSHGRFKEFSLLDLVSEGGRVSSRKFMEFGAWSIASTAIVVTVFRNSLTPELLFVYLASFVAARSLGQWFHTRSDTEVSKAALLKSPVIPKIGKTTVDAATEARSPDAMTVEEEQERRAAELANLRGQATGTEK